VDDDPGTYAQVILVRTRQNKGLPYRLVRRWRQDHSQLLITPRDDVQVNLNGAHVEMVVELDVEAAAEGHCETRGTEVEVANADDVRW